MDGVSGINPDELTVEARSNVPPRCRAEQHRAREKLRELTEALRDPESALVHDLEAATAAAREG